MFMRQQPTDKTSTFFLSNLVKVQHEPSSLSKKDRIVVSSTLKDCKSLLTTYVKWQGDALLLV